MKFEYFRYLPGSASTALLRFLEPWLPTLITAIIFQGSYAYVSTASYLTHKKRATLVSEYLSGFKCISFAYCMNGKNMGQLDASVQTSKGKWINYSFFKKGHQGKDWHVIEISLENPEYLKTSYRVFHSDIH